VAELTEKKYFLLTSQQLIAIKKERNVCYHGKLREKCSIVERKRERERERERSVYNSIGRFE